MELYQAACEFASVTLPEDVIYYITFLIKIFNERNEAEG